jgi:serine/threonine-protein kinase SRPK3
MNTLKLKALEKKKKWHDNNDDTNKDECCSSESYTDSEENLTSDDEFDVSQDMVYTIYNNRYIPIKYLGRGTFSRVWLTYDIHENMLVAMKVLFAKYHEDGLDEIETNEYIKESLNFNENTINLLELKDHFIEKSKEICLIYELMGVCMLDIQDYFDDANGDANGDASCHSTSLIPLPIIKKIVSDILQGLDSLHSINRIHTDLKPENILTNIYSRGINMYKRIFEVDNDFSIKYSQLLDKTLPDNYSELDKNKKKKIKRRCRMESGKQLAKHINGIVDSAIVKLSDDFFMKNNNVTDITDINLDELDIEDAGESKTFKEYQKEIEFIDTDYAKISAKIIDFGNCENPSNLIQDEISIRCYRPPENFMNSFYNEKADIWSIGCLIFEFITGESLFEIDPGSDTNERDRLYLYEMYKIIGKIPKDMTLECEFSKELFDSKGRIKQFKNCEYSSIKQLLIDDFNFDPVIALELDAFLMTIFKYDVDQRPSAKQLQDNIWLNS